MARRLLFLQNGPSKETVSGLEKRFEAAGLTIDYRWAYNGEFPDTLDAYHAVYLSGSPHGAYEDIPFIHREHDLIQDAARRELPMLGICFGAQILGSALCGRPKVFRRATCEVGYVDLDVTPAARTDDIARDLGNQVHMFVWHNDEVIPDPDSQVILATSPDCPTHVWRYRDLPIWAIQGHPEVDRLRAQTWFEASRERLSEDGADVDALIEAAHDTPEAKTLLDNFTAVCLR